MNRQIIIEHTEKWLTRRKIIIALTLLSLIVVTGFTLRNLLVHNDSAQMSKKNENLSLEEFTLHCTFGNQKFYANGCPKDIEVGLTTANESLKLQPEHSKLDKYIGSSYADLSSHNDSSKVSSPALESGSASPSSSSEPSLTDPGSLTGPNSLTDPGPLTGSNERP